MHVCTYACVYVCMKVADPFLITYAKDKQDHYLQD